jgi:addiction module HigA family antidote
VIAPAGSAYGSTRNGESASHGRVVRAVLRMSKSSITIEGTMTRPAIHPGEILSEELTEIAVTPSELARQLRVPANRITQIVHGKRAITGDTALRLGHWFGTSAQFWLNLQSAYEIRVAEKTTGAEIRRLPKRA